jgi:hypothetical protein
MNGPEISTKDPLPALLENANPLLPQRIGSLIAVWPGKRANHSGVCVARLEPSMRLCIQGRKRVSGNLCPELAVTQPVERDALGQRRRFPGEIIQACVRWFLTYRLSYRDLVARTA